MRCKQNGALVTQRFSVSRRSSTGRSWAGRSFSDQHHKQGNVFLRGVERTNCDVLDNGKEFLMIRRSQDQQRAVVVVGWPDELRERMRAAGAR